VIGYAAEAIDQIDALRIHYLTKNRVEAAIALDAALERAERQIQMHPEAGLQAPRPYPEIKRPDRRWLKSGRYWIAYSNPPPVILGVFYDAADLPRRARSRSDAT
jgi:plasmid stabilization system protein ParE